MSSKVKIKKPPDIVENNITENEEETELNEQVYRTIKCPLKSVLKEYDILQPIIEQCVKDVNEIIILGYQFIRLYLLDKFVNNKELPIINKQFILDVLKTVSSTETNKGKQKTETKIKNKSIKDDIKSVYKNTFYKLVNKTLSYSNKTFILEQMAKEMLTCIKTNISTHFLKHLYKYINIKFKNPKSEEIKKEKDKNKRKELYKELNSDIRNLKSDIVQRQILDSKEEYHQWIKDNINLLLPDKFTKSIPYDIKANPEKYIKFSMYINSKTEELGGKPYAFIPQRNNIVVKNIILNTSGISDLIGSQLDKFFSYPKSKITLNCKKYQSHVWSKILKTEKRSIFDNKNYVFYNQIMTDGFNCCLLFILKKYKDKEYGDKIPKYKEDEDNEFIKLNDLTKEECEKYLNGNYVFAGLDPGKNLPVALIDEKNNFFQYSNCRRRVETYTKRSNQIIKNEKEKNGIIDKETILSKFNSRTLKPEEYKKFIVQKTKTNEEVKEFYNNILFRKLNFRRYIFTLQSESKLLDEIENKYLSEEDKNKGKKLLIFFGNWSMNNVKGKMSSPGIGMKRLLHSRFEILETDEFRTSKLYNKNFKELTNVKVRKGKHSKSLHQVLTLKEETEKCIRVNRDKNACMNILLLGKYYLEHQSRPKEFQREKKKTETKKAIKLTEKVNKSTKNKNQIAV